MTGEKVTTEIHFIIIFDWIIALKRLTMVVTQIFGAAIGNRDWDQKQTHSFFYISSINFNQIS